SKIFNKNSKILLLSASIHDLRRVLDTKDEGHGFRADKWFELNHSKYNLNLKKDEINKICKIVRYHEKDNINSSSKLDLEYINLFKLADTLDRFRLPKEKWWLDKKR